MKPADTQNCCAELFLAVQPAECAEVKGIQPRQDLEPEDQMLTTDQVADVIAAVRERAATENRRTPADYDLICREELLRCTGQVPAVPPLAQPVLFYRHCRDGDEEVREPDRAMVVTNVVETAMPDSTPKRRAEVAATWERLLARVDEGADPADLVAALEDDDDEMDERELEDDDPTPPLELLRPRVRAAGT